MGLMDKISDKLHSDKDKDSKHNDPTTSSNDSHLKHPVSSDPASGAYGSSTTVAGYGSNTTGSNIPGTHGSSGLGSNTGTTGYGSSTTGSNIPGSHGTHGTTGSGLTGSHGTHGTTGLGSDTGYGSSTTGSNIPGSHGTTGSAIPGSHGTHGTTGSAIPGSHGTHDTLGRDRDGYGRTEPTMGQKLDPRQDTSTHGAYDTSRGHAGYGSDPTYGRNEPTMGQKLDPRQDTSTHGAYDSRTGGPGYGTHDTYGSNTRQDPSLIDKMNPMKDTSGHREPREPYDPYSSRGQQTAADATIGGHGSSGLDHSTDPNVPRSTHGGVMNPNATNPNAIPHAGGHPVGSSNANDPYASHTVGPTSSSVGGAGYGAGHHGSGLTSDRSMQDPAYNDRKDPSLLDKLNPAKDTSSRHNNPTDPSYNSSSSGVPGAFPGSGGSQPNDPRKMGGAYEAGYRDAMEHAQGTGRH